MNAVGRGERFYAALLRAYPQSFRARYAEEMTVLFHDQLSEARSGTRRAGVTVTWIRGILDLGQSAIGERLRGEGAVAQSLAVFEPSRSMRLLGLFGVIGGVLLLMGFVTWTPFETIEGNTVRLLVFGLSGAAISIAFFARQAAVSRRLTLAITAPLVVVAVWSCLWTVVGMWVPSRFSGTFGWTGAVVNVAFWVLPTFYALAMLRMGAAWQGMSGVWAVGTRLGALLLIGSFMSVVGDDRWGLVDSENLGQFWSTIAVIGVALSGAGWILLGSALVFGRQRVRRTT